MEEELLPEANHTFEVKFEKDMKQVHKGIQRQLSLYKDEKRGATFVAVQSPRGACVTCHFLSSFLHLWKYLCFS